ncbi:MAG: ABC transporter permease [Gammaproteobacteria bacterium]
MLTKTAKAAAGRIPEAVLSKARRPLDPMPWLGMLCALGFWYLAAAMIGRYMPAPHVVFVNAIENFASSQYFSGLGLPKGGYVPHLAVTTRSVVIGVLVGMIIGCPSGLLSARWQTIDQITNPFISTFGTVPILVAAPFVLIWFGLISTAQIILIAFYATVIMHIYTLQAVRNINPKYVEYARSLGAQDGLIFTRVLLPGAVPEIFGGVRVVLAASWGLAAIGELLGARYGVGYAILSFESVYDMTSVMAIVLLLGFIALAMDGLVFATRFYVTRWAETGKMA